MTSSYVETADPAGGSVGSLFESTEVGVKPAWMSLQEANMSGFEEPKTVQYVRKGFVLNEGGDYRLYRKNGAQDDVVQCMTDLLAQALTPYMGGESRAMSLLLDLSVE